MRDGGYNTHAWKWKEDSLRGKGPRRGARGWKRGAERQETPHQVCKVCVKNHNKPYYFMYGTSDSLKSLVKRHHRQTENQTIHLDIKLKSVTEC